MSDINPFEGCGPFCLIWIWSSVYWKTTGLLLSAVIAVPLVGRFRERRKLWIGIPGALLVAHLLNAAYFNWLH